MLLLDEHIDIISAKLKDGGIKDTLLHNDLLDHICTFIEQSDSDDFDALLQQALYLVAPNGVHEIEEERFFLFHFHKQLTMKRALFFSGFTATFLITTGITFKQMHWPGANIMLMYGYVALLLSIILIGFNAFRHANAHTAAFKARIIIGIVAGSLISLGSIFKLHHWPSANIQFVLGILLLNFLFLPMFFYQLYQRSLRS